MSFKKDEKLRLSSGLLKFEDGTMFGSPWSMTETVSSVDSLLIPVSENCSINAGIKRGGIVRVPSSCWLHGTDVKTIIPCASATEGITAFLYHRNHLVATKTLSKNEIILPNENSPVRTVWIRFNFDTPLYLIEGETYRLVIGATNLLTDDPVGIPVYKCWDAVADNSSLKPISFPYTSLEDGSFIDSENDDCGMSIIVSWDELDETRRRQYGRE